MSDNIGRHEPTPEFRARLEWQVLSEYRRGSRFDERRGVQTSGPKDGSTVAARYRSDSSVSASNIQPRWRRLRAAIVILAAVAVGGIGGVASAQVQDARQREQLLISARYSLELAQLRLQLARTEFEQARQRYELGAIDRESVLAAEAGLREMQAAVQRHTIDVQEIQATAALPSNELTAPRVGGRDFVRERLMLEMQSAQHALAAAEQAVEVAEQRLRLGTGSAVASEEARAELAGARAAMELLHAKLRLRERFLESDLTAEQLAHELRSTELRLALEQAQQRAQLARQRLEMLRLQRATGGVQEIDLMRAQVELLEREADLQRIMLEIELLERRLGSDADSPHQAPAT